MDSRPAPRHGAPDPRIERIEVHQVRFSLNDLTKDYHGFNLVYEPGAVVEMTSRLVHLVTDQGASGTAVGASAADVANIPIFWHFLKGRSALEREVIYDEVRRALRQHARIGLAPIDIALWDLAGRWFGVSLCKLLGGSKRTVPCYASTYHGDESGGLDSPEAYADFALQARELGYPAFKIHGWGNAPVRREVDNVLAVRTAVGDQMELMLDPACELVTFGDALTVGRACDEGRYFWYEDPFRDGGISQFAHRKLRQLIRTPLLQTEHVRSLEPHIDFALADATDYLRADIGYDGVTGVLKLAHAAESLGLDVEFHGPGPAVRQMMAAVRNTNYYEMGLVHPKAPISEADGLYVGYRDALDAVDGRGHVAVPQGPGLGVDVDWDWVAAHRVALETFS